MEDLVAAHACIVEDIAWAHAINAFLPFFDWEGHVEFPGEVDDFVEFCHLLEAVPVELASFGEVTSFEGLAPKFVH